MSDEKPTDAEAVFAKLDGLTSFMDTDMVAGHEVKEWSTTQFTKLYPYLSMLAKTLMEGGATFANLKTYLTSNWPKLIDAVIPHMVPIITISCPTVKPEDLDELPWTTGMEFIMAIFKKNINHIADFFAQRAGQLLDESPVDSQPKKSSQPQ